MDGLKMDDLKMPSYSEMNKMQKVAYIVEWIIGVAAIVLVVLNCLNMLDNAYEIVDFLIGIDCLLSAFICWTKSRKAGILYLVLGIILVIASVLILIIK
ncbi:MAG TPA: hypothetical protein PLB45_02920 [Bacilli bacterium]|jgi:hypothetical protein|nr:hypothetical protein [Bacilli bacterium]